MDDTIKILNSLIETSEDGKKGFSEAADKVEDAGLKQLLSERAQGCGQAVRELRTLVTALGGTPDEGGSLSGAAHRGWVKLKSAIAANDNLAVLEEVERGEDVAKAAYEKALKADLPVQVKTVVEKQYQGVLRNHERVKELRNQYRRAA